MTLKLKEYLHTIPVLLGASRVQAGHPKNELSPDTIRPETASESTGGGLSPTRSASHPPLQTPVASPGASK